MYVVMCILCFVYKMREDHEGETGLCGVCVVSQSVVALPLYVFCDYESEVKKQLFFCSSLLKSETTWLHPGSSDLIHVCLLYTSDAADES